MGCLAAAIQVANKRDDTALEVEGRLAICAIINQREPKTLVEICRFTQTIRKRFKRVLSGGEDFRIRMEDCTRAATCACDANLCNFCFWLAAFVLLHPNVSISCRFHTQLHAECVDNGDADTVKSTRNFVSAAAKLSTGMEHGVHDFECIFSR